MITRIREVRRARKLTLQEVAERCDPPTTPQTIGRLETGARTVSVGWLNRIAGALGVEAADLVRLPDREDVPVAATLGPDGAHAPARDGVVVPPRPAPGLIAMTVSSSASATIAAATRSGSPGSGPSNMPARSTATCWCRAPPAASCSAG